MVREPHDAGEASEGGDPILEEDLQAFLGDPGNRTGDAGDVTGGDPDDGSCAICHDAPGRNTCVSCGRGVCSAHYWTMFALCHECATEEEIRAVRGDPSADRYRELLGIKWVE